MTYMKSVNIEGHYKGPMFVILAGICWGILGIFSRVLSANGFSAIQITAVRCVVTAITLTMYLFLKDRNKLKIDIKDIWYFIGTGTVSVVLLNIFYFLTIEETTLSIAAILLYTAPYFVVILSAIFFNEKITSQKVIALLLAFLGCVLVTGIIGSQSFKLTSIGLLTGIGSGFCYALYSIFGTIALRKYDTMTVTAYTFIVAAVSIVPFSHPGEMAEIIMNSNVVMMNGVLIGIISTLFAFLFYTKGLQNMEAGKASVLAFIEPMVATITGILIFNEQLNIQNMAGISLIFISIVLLNMKMKSK